MRFMVIVKATKYSEAGKMPSEELLSAMAKFNEEMVKAGVMLDGNGLQCQSLAEAIEWIKRCPNPHNEDSEIEIRQLFELEDFGASEAVEHHRRLGEQIGKK